MTSADELTAELEARVAAVVPIGPDSGLAARLIGRARARRRHRRTAVASALALAVVVVGLSAPGLRARHHAAPTATRPSVTADLARELASGRGVYAVNSPSGDVPRATVHLRGRVIDLPEGWRVQEIQRAGAGVVVQASADFQVFVAAYVGADGTIRQLPEINSSLVVTPDGRQVVGTYRAAPVLGEGEVLQYDLGTGQIADRAPFDPDRPAHTVGGVLSDGRVVVSGDPAGVQVWRPDTRTVSTIPGTAKRWAVAAVALDGKILLSDGHGKLRLIDESGTVLPPPVLTPHQGQFDLRPIESTAVFSPDSSKLAFVAANRTLVIDDLVERSQQIQSLPQPPPVAGGSLLMEPLVTLRWDDNDVLEVALSQEHQVTIASCLGTTTRCGAVRSVTLPVSGDVVLAH